jgi:hypothetical protein
MMRAEGQGLVMSRTMNRSQGWVGGWISRLITPSQLLNDSQQPRAEAVDKWLSDNQDGDRSDILDEQNDRCHLTKHGHLDWKADPGHISFVILPFSRKVLPIMRKNPFNEAKRRKEAGTEKVL